MTEAGWSRDPHVIAAGHRIAVWLRRASCDCQAGTFSLRANISGKAAWPTPLVANAACGPHTGPGSGCLSGMGLVLLIPLSAPPHPFSSSYACICIRSICSQINVWQPNSHLLLGKAVPRQNPEKSLYFNELYLEEKEQGERMLGLKIENLGFSLCDLVTR